MNQDIPIQLLGAFFGTLGFGILFNIRGKKLLWAALGGMIAWALFLLLGLWIQGEPMRYFIVALWSTAYSELLARILKTPATTFCIITLIPLVPGGALYYTMTHALSGNIDSFIPRLINTIELAVALSLGIVIITAVSRIFGKKEAKK